MKVLDVESYPNYFLIAFKGGDVTHTFELRGEDDKFTRVQTKEIRDIMMGSTLGFNSNKYDLPMITLSLHKTTVKELNKLSNRIIKQNLQPWQMDFDIIPTKHTDIKDVGTGVMVSLKLYGARINTQLLKDLPYPPDTILTSIQMDEVNLYCINDLDVTIDLAKALKERLKLRSDMSKRYGINLMSKSDAQIAEAVFRSKLGHIKAPKTKKVVGYDAPSYITFKSQALKDLLNLVNTCEFAIKDSGAVTLPPELAAIKIQLGRSTYRVGIGGLHSSEKKQAIIPKKGERLLDRDVAAYYPSLILNLDLSPKHLTDFSVVYREIVEERLEAKHSGNKIVNESLKITINGSFGKLGSKYSMLYAPDMMLAVTLTGQLSLLMLIEQLTDAGIDVVSANTDGFVSLVPDELYDIYDMICFNWELDTALELEETEYSALYSRDVNNYLAVKDDSYKGKGVFTKSSMSKNPQASICQTAVAEFLTHGEPIENTIRHCDDITKFMMVRTVTGGAKWRDDYLGKVVRWVYTVDGDTIHYVKNGNKVPLSDGALPIKRLHAIPIDLNYDKYIEMANKLLNDVGV